MAANRSERTPWDDAVGDPSDLQESVLTLLEDAGIDTATNDQIMRLIIAAEVVKARADNDHPLEPTERNHFGEYLDDMRALAEAQNRGIAARRR